MQHSPSHLVLRTGADLTQPVAKNHHCPGKRLISIEMSLTVRRRVPLGHAAGHSGSVVMFEAFTAFFGVMSAGIFIAHAVDGYRSRA
jgi:hypothetical protein